MCLQLHTSQGCSCARTFFGNTGLNSLPLSWFTFPTRMLYERVFKDLWLVLLVVFGAVALPEISWCVRYNGEYFFFDICKHILRGIIDMCYHLCIQVSFILIFTSLIAFKLTKVPCTSISHDPYSFWVIFDQEIREQIRRPKSFLELLWFFLEIWITLNRERSTYNHCFYQTVIFLGNIYGIQSPNTSTF